VFPEYVNEKNKSHMQTSELEMPGREGNEEQIQPVLFSECQGDNSPTKDRSISSQSGHKYQDTCSESIGGPKEGGNSIPKGHRFTSQNSHNSKEEGWTMVNMYIGVYLF